MLNISSVAWVDSMLTQEHVVTTTRYDTSCLQSCSSVHWEAEVRANAWPQNSPRWPRPTSSSTAPGYAQKTRCGGWMLECGRHWASLSEVNYTQQSCRTVVVRQMQWYFWSLALKRWRRFKDDRPLVLLHFDQLIQTKNTTTAITAAGQIWFIDSSSSSAAILVCDLEALCRYCAVWQGWTSQQPQPCEIKVKVHGPVEQITSFVETFLSFNDQFSQWRSQFLCWWPVLWRGSCSSGAAVVIQ